MTFYLIKRLLVTLATLLAASVVVFAVLEVLPGNAAQVLMGPDADPAAVAAKAAELGLLGGAHNDGLDDVALLDIASLDRKSVV